VIVFPNCKINLGLNVVSRRGDGYHDIETILYPVNWCDALEAVAAKDRANGARLEISGMATDISSEDNLVLRAWRLLENDHSLPAANLFLHKAIPTGAGLGGGSSDAAFTIRLISDLFDLRIPEERLHGYAAKLGSDCPFFVTNVPVIARGKGDDMQPIKVDLSAYYILIVHPRIHSSTAEAYSNIVPGKPAEPIEEIIAAPVSTWRNRLINQFEATMVHRYPEIRVLKEKFYSAGATYASMSGSGSAVYGIFSERPRTSLQLYDWYLQEPAHAG
jgi:4-diphosphocytidyl-2-C-methyl-D-erythritol kinase